MDLVICMHTLERSYLHESKISLENEKEFQKTLFKVLFLGYEFSTVLTIGSVAKNEKLLKIRKNSNKILDKAKFFSIQQFLAFSFHLFRTVNRYFDLVDELFTNACINHQIRDSHSKLQPTETKVFFTHKLILFTIKKRTSLQH